MKKILLVLLALVVIAQAVVAQHNTGNVILKFGAVAPRIPAEGIPIKGGTFVVAVGANTDWYVSEVSDFCKVRATGKQFEVSVKPNRSSTNRTIYVVL